MSEKTTGDGLSKGLGIAVALGALAVGVATAVMNNDRTRQVRDELKQRVDELGRRVDELTAEAQKRATELSAQAQRTIEERRPDIESTIQKSREAVIEGLDKAKTVVEQGAEKAQEYVQRASTQASDKSGDVASASGDMADQAAHTATGPSPDTTDGVKDWTGGAGRELSEVMSREDGNAGDRNVGDASEQATSYMREGLGNSSTDTGDILANSGNTMEDAMSDIGGTEGSPRDDLSTSSADIAVSGEDMSGDDFTERDAEQSGFQMHGSIHMHEIGDEGASNGSAPTDAGNSAFDTGEAGESQSNFSMGEPTIPFHADNNPDANNDVDNEPPHPGDTRTYK